MQEPENLQPHQETDTEPEQGTAASPEAVALLPSPPLPPARPIAGEPNLLLNGYWDASYKRRYPGRPIKNRKGEIVGFTPTSKQVRVKDGTIGYVPSAEYGFASAQDGDFIMALLAICDRRATRDSEVLPDGRRLEVFVLPQPLAFSVGEFMRVAGRERPADRRAARLFFQRNNAIAIHGSWRRAVNGSVFREVLAGTDPLIRKFLWVGDRMEDGTRSDCVRVTLADWFVSNYRYGLYGGMKTVDVQFHFKLDSPVAAALAPLLDSGWRASGGPWSKRYSDLVQLLGIERHRYLADVKKQLGDPDYWKTKTPTQKRRERRPLVELHEERYLADWSYRATTPEPDWIISFTPGEKWFRDRGQEDERRRLAGEIEQGTRPLGRDQGDASSVHGEAAAPAALTSEEEYLLDLLEHAAGPRDSDGHSRPFFEKCVRTIRPYAKLSAAAWETREAARRGKIDRSAAQYLTGILKRHLAAAERPAFADPALSPQPEQPVPPPIAEAGERPPEAPATPAA